MNIHASEQPYDFYEELRKYPRIKIKLPIKLFIDGDKYVNANIYDISPDGLQIRCNREVAVTLNPSGKKIKAEDELLVRTEFELPLNDGQKRISVECKLYYFVMIPDEADEDIAFGLKFKTFSGKSIKYIGRHILNELEPAVI